MDRARRVTERGGREGMEKEGKQTKREGGVLEGDRGSERGRD